MYGWLLSNAVTWLGALAALRYPLIGLYVYVGLAILRPQFIFGFAGDLSGLSQIVGIGVLVGWAFQGFGSWRLGRGRAVAIAYLVFVLWFLLSGVLAINPEGSRQASIELMKAALPLCVGFSMMNDERDWRAMLWTIVLCQGYVSFEMNLNYVFKGYNTAADGFGGADNNFFGLSLVCVFGPALALMLWSRTWRGRAVAAICAALILHTTLLTFSRGAMLGLLAVGAVTAALMPKRPKYVVALVIVALLVVRFTGPQLLSRYSSTFARADERDASAESRVELWLDCLKVVESYPVFGVGPWNWSVIAKNFGWAEGKSAHSVWMESAAEIGLPGVSALLLFFLIAAVRMWPIARGRPAGTTADERALATGVVLTVAGFLVSGQFVSGQGLETPYYIVMVGAAMLKTTSRRGAPEIAPSATVEPAVKRHPALSTLAPASRVSKNLPT
jgi:O-antigen ligase